MINRAVISFLSNSSHDLQIGAYFTSAQKTNTKECIQTVGCVLFDDKRRFDGRQNRRVYATQKDELFAKMTLNFCLNPKLTDSEPSRRVVNRFSCVSITTPLYRLLVVVRCPFIYKVIYFCCCNPEAYFVYRFVRSVLFVFYSNIYCLHLPHVVVRISPKTGKKQTADLILKLKRGKSIYSWKDNLIVHSQLPRMKRLQKQPLSFVWSLKKSFIFQQEFLSFRRKQYSFEQEKNMTVGYVQELIS